MPETGIDQINEETTPGQTDDLSSHLLGGKKKHDEDKNVETEEVQHLDKGIFFDLVLTSVIPC